ncbi:MAG: DNA-3-methyladenine glycosylase [Chthonomonas sp.]|nr:DNA-3-methyladenine glycosylase [Chthonomonas sp.]
MSHLEEFRRALNEDVVEASRLLLGLTMAVGEHRAKIVEAEAYGPTDPGCHAFRGETPRLRAMFGAPGFAYVYFTYGNHWMLNVSALPEGTPAAILIRAARPLTDPAPLYANRAKAKRDRDLLSGPGKLCAAYGIDARHYGLNFFDAESEIQLLAGEPPGDIVVGTRIGLAPGKGDDYLWRFWDRAEQEYVSRPLTFS